jgi:transposase
VLGRLRTQAEKLVGTIAFNRRNPGDTPEEEVETEKLLKELRAERANVLADLAAYDAAQNRVIAPPTPEKVLDMLADLEQILTSAASAETYEEMRIARRIIDALTGGRIDLFQMGERKAQRGWLQGRFEVRLLSVLVDRVTGAKSSHDDEGIDVVIDYREPSEIEVQSERAKELYDQGMMQAEIAKRFGCSRSRVTALLRYWFESRGLVMPDGRSRRASLKTKHLDPPLYQRIADEVMVLWRQKMLLQDIADRLQIDRNTVTSAVRWWHEVRGLPIPDGRTRRKELNRKTTPKCDEPDEEDSP